MDYVFYSLRVVLAMSVWTTVVTLYHDIKTVNLVYYFGITAYQEVDSKLLAAY